MTVRIVPRGAVTMDTGCAHNRRRCVNQYDTFRKYLCLDCGVVHICACEEQLARQFLPHQTRNGREYGTRKRYIVKGFASNLCPDCRGERESPHPMAAVQGRKEKTERFYWREITKTFYSLAREWLVKNGVRVSDILDFQSRFPDLAKSLRKQARQHWQSEHRSNPKYDMSEPTKRDFHADTDVPEIVVHAPYAQVQRADQKLGKWQNSKGELVSAEAIAMEFYGSKVWEPHVCERKLISILYGAFCFAVVQDSRDPRVVVGYSNSTRGWTGVNRNTGLIAIPLPEDFGTPEYFERRREEYTRLFSFLRHESLARLFEEWLTPSENLRDYLWVNDDSAVALARVALSTIPGTDILRWIEWAAADFWQRQRGWPDLLLIRGDSYRFVEVKSPHDELSQEQMLWLKWALGEANLPCEVCRIKKIAQASSDTVST